MAKFHRNEKKEEIKQTRMGEIPEVQRPDASGSVGNVHPEDTCKSGTAPMARPSYKLLRARDMMERGVRSVDPDTTIRELAEIFNEEGMSGLPVIDKKGRLVGIVSKTDIARTFAETTGPQDEGMESVLGIDESEDMELQRNGIARDTTPITARSIMSADVVTAGEDESAGELASRMLEHGIHRVIITKRNEVAGVVSSFDLLRAIVEYESLLGTTNN